MAVPVSDDVIDPGTRKYWLRGLSRLGGGWPMAAEDLAVGGASFGRAVGMEDQGPAEAVDADLVVVLAEQDQVRQAGLAAVGAVHDVVDLASRRGLVATAGPCTVPVAEDDQAAEVIRDALDLADVQGEGLAVERDAKLAGAQVGGQPVRSGHGVGGHGEEGAA